MKHKLLQLFFAFSPFLLAAQNWFPLPPAERLSYRHSDSLLISQEINMESYQSFPNGDQVWQLNRIGKFCDTCAIPACYRNQGQMLQKTMTLHPNGDVLFSGEQHLLVKPNASLGETWLFDPLNNVTATVTEISAGQVLGEPDSIKTISLNNGGEIRLSRQHGIVSFPATNPSATFELVGIQALGLGIWSPTYREIYDFQVGDLFQYTGYFTQGLGTANNASTAERWRILEKWEQADTIFYRTDRWVKTQFFGPFSTNVRDTIIQKIHPAFITPWTEAAPNQLWFVPGLLNIVGSDSAFAMVRLNNNTPYGLSKTIGGNISGQTTLPGCQIMFPSEQASSELMQCDVCFDFTNQVSVGLGLTFHRYGCFEYFEENALIGYVKNGDTSGILYPDSYFSKTSEPAAAIELAVQPNPADADWLVQFDAFESPGEGQLFDVQGQLVERFPIEKGGIHCRVSGGKLPAGVYVLHIGNLEKWGVCRLLKK